ncbi:homoserine kinase [Actinopolymorpha sp. B11F2]|uniref:homoserine kinase n=1 Tax=Actinopolymorpha sp. B11F2 TaxID=3160862 RepID=UPI0032E44AA3
MRFRADPVRVRVPATSANLGPGFDALGLALGMYDEVEVRPTPSGLTVEVVGEGAALVPRDGTNLVVRALRTALDELGGQPPGLALTCTNRIPHGRGMGSSAAAIVAGIVAARALVSDGGTGLDDAAVIALGSALEGHPDNVAACVLGGLTIAWTPAGSRARAIRLEPVSVSSVVFVPDSPLATETARAALPDLVPHADAAVNAGRAALLVAALAGGHPVLAGGHPVLAGGHPVLAGGPAAPAEVDIDLLLAATEDRLHQPYRASAMPASAALVADLRARGVPAVVSGAGPSVLAFAPLGTAHRLAEAAPTGFRAYEVPLDLDGARILPPTDGNSSPWEDVEQGEGARPERFC